MREFKPGDTIIEYWNYDGKSGWWIGTIIPTPIRGMCISWITGPGTKTDLDACMNIRSFTYLYDGSVHD